MAIFRTQQRSRRRRVGLALLALIPLAFVVLALLAAPLAQRDAPASLVGPQILGLSRAGAGMAAPSDGPATNGTERSRHGRQR